MTAEVAVLNKFGVALAADSAVTVDHYHHEEIHQKIYNSANKLFTLSKHAPVGIMIYNTVTLGGVPYETLIKEYRRTLGRTRLATLEAYANHFFTWLSGNILFSDTNVADIVNTNLLRPFHHLTIDFSTDPPKPVKSKSGFVSNLDKRLKELRAEEFVHGFDDASAKQLVAKYQQEIKEAASAFIKTSYRQGQKRKLDELAGLLLTKKRPLRGYSGVVIAGFGENEALPRLREYIVDIIVDGRIRYWERSSYVVDEKSPSQVVPLADAGAINTLTQGISADYEEEVIGGLMKILARVPSAIITPITELTTAQKNSYIQNSTQPLLTQLQDYWKSLQEHKHKNYTFPMNAAIAALPLSDLSLVAETFLGIAQIQKRVTAEEETVGGPVDVAVISKGDGFIWTKRKFYFEEKLNPSFKLKYLET